MPSKFVALNAEGVAILAKLWPRIEKVIDEVCDEGDFPGSTRSRFKGAVYLAIGKAVEKELEN